MKRCNKCEKEKDLSEFTKDKNNIKDGRGYYCKECWKTYNTSEHRKKQKTKAMRSYQGKNKDAIQRYNQNYYLKKYKISLEEKDEMWIKQNKRCKICNREILFSRSHLDHCHETGEIRGILCPQCNTGLGMFKDSIESLHAAILYLSS